MLRRLDRRHHIRFTNIAASDFRASAFGVSWDELMAEIHGRGPDGEWVKGVEVFRRLYDAAGFESAVRVSRLPVVRQGLDLGYRVFARYRTRLTGRCTDGSCHLKNNNRVNSARQAVQAKRMARESQV